VPCLSWRRTAWVKIEHVPIIGDRKTDEAGKRTPAPGYATLPMPIQLARDSLSALHIQICEQIRSLIEGDRLKPGSRLPSSRQLAEHLAVSRNTVLVAYQTLAMEGYIEAREGSRTMVRDKKAGERPLRPSQVAVEAPQAAIRRQPVVFQGDPPRLVHFGRKPIFDFFVGRPCPLAFPIRAWRRLMLQRLASAGPALSEYQHPAGLTELRHAIADHLGPARGMNVRPAQIVVVNGIQEALNIVARLFVEKGTPVAIENPCYQGALSTFASYGAQMLPVAVDQHGIKPEELPEQPVSLIYVTPSHQFPTGSTLPLDRRLALLDWACRVGAYVVEDDYDSDVRFDGPPLTALAGLDNSKTVIYLGTFSKSIGASLRLGYLVVPLELAEAATAVKALLNAGQSWLEQAVMAEFIRSGGYARHLNQIRMTYRARRDCLLNALRGHFGDVRITGYDGGMHVMWHLPADLPDARSVEGTALTHGVGIYSLRSAVAYDFGITPYSERSLVLGYTALQEAQIREGIARVAVALE
jgi:GntR family transcriptional regulator / MocR family aminotransferase